MKKLKTKDKTVLKALGLGGCYGGGGEGVVDILDGRIVRIHPFHYERKHEKEGIRTWKKVSVSRISPSLIIPSFSE